MISPNPLIQKRFTDASGMRSCFIVLRSRNGNGSIRNRCFVDSKAIRRADLVLAGVTFADILLDVEVDRRNARAVPDKAWSRSRDARLST